MLGGAAPFCSQSHITSLVYRLFRGSGSALVSSRGFAVAMLAALAPVDTSRCSQNKKSGGRFILSPRWRVLQVRRVAGLKFDLVRRSGATTTLSGNSLLRTGNRHCWNFHRI